MDVYSPDKETSSTLDELYSALNRRPLPEAPRLIANDGVPIELSPQIAHILRTIVGELHNGRSITVVAHDAKWTTQQAADHLGVSRPTLIKMLDKFSVPVETTGRHRRIAFGDLRDLQIKIKGEQISLLKEMAELAATTGQLDSSNFENPLIR